MSRTGSASNRESAPGRPARSRGIDDTRSSVLVASATVLPLVAILVGVLSLNWLSVRTGEDTTKFSALELPVLNVALIVAVTVIVVGVVIEGAVLRRWPLSVPAVGAVFVLVCSVVVLIAEEMAAGAIPTSVLPVSVRRLTVGVYGGAGIWLAIPSALLLVAACRAEGGGGGIARRCVSAAQRLPLKLLAMLVFASLLVGAAAWARYLPWASGSAATKNVVVPGWSLPFIGPASLVAVFVLAGAAALLVARLNLFAALVLTFAGWFCAFLSAIGIVASSALARVEVDRYLPDAVVEYSPTVDARWGAWVMFVAGCAIAACGAGIVAWLERAAR